MHQNETEKRERERDRKVIVVYFESQKQFAASRVILPNEEWAQYCGRAAQRFPPLLAQIEQAERERDEQRARADKAEKVIREFAEAYRGDNPNDYMIPLAALLGYAGKIGEQK